MCTSCSHAKYGQACELIGYVWLPYTLPIINHFFLMANIVAIVGRPNVGKSTLFNRLVEQRKAIMDNESGITRDRHYGYAEWTDKHFTVIDTGGYVKNSNDIFESAIRQQVQIAIDEASVILFLVDCKDGLTQYCELLASLYW